MSLKKTTEQEIQNDKKGSRKEYLRQYYLRNKEKARAYQRLYNLKHRKKIDSSRLQLLHEREPIQQTYTIRDIAFSTTEKSIKMINNILSNERNLSLSYRDRQVQNTR